MSREGLDRALRQDVLDSHCQDSTKAAPQGDSELPVWNGELGRLCAGFMEFDDLYGRFAKAYGESYFSLWTLEEIGDRPQGVTQKDLSKLLHLPKQTLSSIVSSLVKRGLVDTRPNPVDGRSKVHTLTQKGRALYGRERADLGRIDHEVCEALGKERVEAMNDTLSSLNRELDLAFGRLFGQMRGSDASGMGDPSPVRDTKADETGDESGVLHA